MNIFLKKLFLKFHFYIKLLLLSPGVIVHEISHILFCIISRVKIIKFRLFRFSEISGYVEHEKPKDLFSAFLISFGPLFLNTIVSYFLFKKFDLKFLELKNIIFLYLAISIGLSAIPSDMDGKSFADYIRERINKNFLFFPLFIFMPLVWVLNLLNYLKFFLVDYIFVFIIFYIALYL